MGLISILKRLPIDLGQGNYRFVTKGKVIAQQVIPPDGSGKTLLDLGCREGVQSKAFEAMGYSVTAVDINAEYEKCWIVDANQPLPFDNETFDVIWSSEVIEHLVDPWLTVRELRRVLKPSGVMVLTTPNSFATYFCWIAAIGLTPQRIQRYDHRHFFDLSQIRTLFPDASVYGYLPFTLARPCISRGVGLFSPTFVIHEKKCA
jgi:SAM-dependent methyltransferase